MPKNRFPQQLTNETKKCVIFILSISYFNLTYSIFVFVQNCNVLEFLKRLSKAVTKFHGKNISTLDAGRNL